MSTVIHRFVYAYLVCVCLWLYGCRCCGILWCIYLPSDACDYSIVYHLQFTRPQTNTEVDVCLCGSWEYGVVKCDVVFSVHIFVSFICVFCLFIVHSLIRERPNASLCPCPFPCPCVCRACVPHDVMQSNLSASITSLFRTVCWSISFFVWIRSPPYAAKAFSCQQVWSCAHENNVSIWISD